MPSNYLTTLLKSLRTRYRLRWITITLILVIATGASFAISTSRTPDEFFDYTATIAWGVIGALLFLLSFFIESFVLTHKRIATIIDAPHDLYYLTVHAKTGEIDHALHDELEKLTDDELNQYTLFHVSSRAMGITWIFGVIIVLIGLLLVATTPLTWIFIPFSTAALLIVILHHPKHASIKARLHKAKQKRA